MSALAGTPTTAAITVARRGDELSGGLIGVPVRSRLAYQSEFGARPEPYAKTFFARGQAGNGSENGVERLPSRSQADDFWPPAIFESGFHICRVPKGLGTTKADGESRFRCQAAFGYLHGTRRNRADATREHENDSVTFGHCSYAEGPFLTTKDQLACRLRSQSWKARHFVQKDSHMRRCDFDRESFDHAGVVNRLSLSVDESCAESARACSNELLEDSGERRYQLNSLALAAVPRPHGVST